MSIKVIGGKIPLKEHKKLVTEDAVSEMIERTMAARPESVGKKVRGDSMFAPGQFGPMWVSPLINDQLLFAPPEDVNHPDICWPMSIGKLSATNSVEYGREIHFTYWRSVDPKKLRGKYRFIGRKNIGFFAGVLGANGEFASAVEYAGWDGKRWRTCNRIRYDETFMDAVSNAGTAPIKAFLDKGDDEIGIRAACGQTIALTLRYEWGAQFSIAGSPKVIVPTTPRGILELFNDRDKPEENGRRTALRHWVNQHIRRANTGSFRHVRSHLRGEMSFKWRGYDVTVKPSQFDTEQNEAR